MHNSAEVTEAKSKKNSVIGRVLAPDVLGRNGWDILEAREDLEAICFSNEIDGNDLLELLSRYNRVVGIILGHSPFGEEALVAAPELRVVSRIGVGYDAVDVSALSRRGVPLMIAGDANATSVAEHAMYMMLTLAKRGPQTHALVQEGLWNKRVDFLPSEISGKVVLIVGFGRIGTRLAKRCLVMEAKVIVYDPYVSANFVADAGCEYVTDLDLAVERADFVTLHCPKSAETLRMFDAERIGRMKKTAFLVNTARGGIVNEFALYHALLRRDIAGAGVDVFESEPAHPELPMLTMPNVVISPHVAGVTYESVARMAELAVNNLLGVLDGRPDPRFAVNPDACFDPGDSAHRDQEEEAIA